jgi:hypothetical protein
MGARLQLHELFKGLLGSSYVYFQPPSTVTMMYPCIVYSRNNLDTKFADDQPYGHKTGYQVTVIDPNPDSEILGKVAALPLCSFNRHYTKDNLNHDVYNLYY